MIPDAFVRPLVFASGLLFSLVISCLFTGWIKNVALQRGWLDQPDARKVHKTPIPRLGGVAIATGFFLTLFYFYVMERLWPETLGGMIAFPSPNMLLGALIMALTGLVDDLMGYKPFHKFFLQFCVAIMVVLEGYRFNFLPADWLGMQADWILVPVTILWIVGVINAINLIDGMDGLAAGIAVIVMSSLAAVLAVTGTGADLVFVVAFVGALFGFLVFNFYPAKIFMGDTGSLFIGFVLATYALPVTGETNYLLAFLLPVAALGLPILDTSTAFIRRMLEGRSPFSPDKEHIHHRISRQFNLGHRGTVLTLYGVCAAFGAISVFLATTRFRYVAFSLAVTAMVTLLLLLRLGYINPAKGVARLLGRAREDTAVPVAVPAEENPPPPEEPAPRA